MRLRVICVSILALGLFSLGTSSCGLVAAEAAGTSTGPVEQAISVDLDYQETAFEVLRAKVVFGPQKAVEATPFKKEPPPSGGLVRRQFLQLGGNTNNLMAVLWEPPSTLHLDLNRNLDLTDDPQGVFSLSTTSRGDRAFTHIQVEAGGTRYCFDLRLVDRGGALDGTAFLRSFCQGRIEIGGKPWQVGAVRNPFEPSL